MDLSRRAELLPREVRKWQTTTELRDDDPKVLRFHGEASVVETPYTVRDQLGEFSETIAEGAFTRTLSEKPDVVFLINHEGLPLARTGSGTLRLSATPHLTADADFDPEDPDVKRLAPKILRGDVDQMSFAFRVIRQEWNADYTDRRITELSLHRGDVSSVTFGASPTTSGTLRTEDPETLALAEALDALRSGTLTDDQIDVLRRTASSIDDLLPAESAERNEDPAVELALLELLARRDAA